MSLICQSYNNNNNNNDDDDDDDNDGDDDDNNSNNNNEYFNRMTHECIKHCYHRGPVKETVMKIR